MEKYSYGTTGDRILVDFSVNGTRQGSTITTSGNPTITLEAHGTDLIAWIEIVKHQIGTDDYEVLRRVEPDAMDVSLTVEDPHYSSATLYYARLRQKTYVRNRPVQAWSSPVWVE